MFCIVGCQNGRTQLWCFSTTLGELGRSLFTSRVWIDSCRPLFLFCMAPLVLCRKCIRFFITLLNCTWLIFTPLSRECEEAYPSVPIGGRFVSKLLPDARTLPARRVVFFLGLLFAECSGKDFVFHCGWSLYVFFFFCHLKFWRGAANVEQVNAYRHIVCAKRIIL